MDILGQWFYAKWLGGCCTLELSGDGVLFSEGKLVVTLHYGNEGWWEGPAGTSVRLRREGNYLVLQRQNGTKNTWHRQFRAAKSSCRAKSLCCASSFCCSSRPNYPK